MGILKLLPHRPDNHHRWIEAILAPICNGIQAVAQQRVFAAPQPEILTNLKTDQAVDLAQFVFFQLCQMGSLQQWQIRQQGMRGLLHRNWQVGINRIGVPEILLSPHPASNESGCIFGNVGRPIFVV